MQVKCHYRNDHERPLEDPVVELDNPLTVQPMDGRAFIFRFMSGDVCTPVLGTLFGEQWFGPNFPRWVLRFYCPLWASVASTVLATLLLVENVAAVFVYSHWWALLLLVTVPLWLIAPGKFIAFRWPGTERALYAGAKVFGVDAPEYKLWPVGIKPEDVYEGSKALCLSIRPSARIR